jgi:hypothetical protein
VTSLHNVPTTGGSFSRLRPNKIPILRPGLGSKLLGTNLNTFEANRIFELDPALDPKLAAWFSKPLTLL